LGDLVLTCTGDLSRNRTVGVELARGRKLEEIVGSMRMVAEGIKTTDAAVDLASRYSVGNADCQGNVPDVTCRFFAAGGHPAVDGAVAQRRINTLTKVNISVGNSNLHGGTG